MVACFAFLRDALAWAEQPVALEFKQSYRIGGIRAVFTSFEAIRD
jgi:hypothetical protein